MTTIIPFLQDDAFGPDDIEAMSAALDDICKLLKLRDCDRPARMVVAERIIALARQGERRPVHLRNRVLMEAGVADRELLDIRVYPQ